MRLQDLGQLGADPERRVQRRPRVLRDIGHGASAQPPQRALAQLGDVAPVDQHRPAGHAGAAPAVSEHRHPDGGLAAAGLADQPEHLPGVNLDPDLVDYSDARAGELDPQIADLDRRGARRRERAHDFALRSSPIAARATPSATRLVPTVSRPMAATGSSTPQG